MKTKRRKEVAYPCTGCGGDAIVGFTNWTGPEGVLIGKKERLCLVCARKRGVDFDLRKKT